MTWFGRNRSRESSESQSVDDRRLDFATYSSKWFDVLRTFYSYQKLLIYCDGKEHVLIPFIRIRVSPVCRTISSPCWILFRRRSPGWLRQLVSVHYPSRRQMSEPSEGFINVYLLKCIRTLFKIVGFCERGSLYRKLDRHAAEKNTEILRDGFLRNVILFPPSVVQ